MGTRREFLSAFAGGATLAAASSVGGPGLAAAQSKISFRGKSGINVFWPWGGPLVDDPRNPHTSYAALTDVFGPVANGPWDAHVTGSVYAQCRDVGIDHFRVQYNPGPWMQAVRRQDPAYLNGLFDQFDATVEHSLRAGIAIVLDPYLTGYVRDDPASVLQRPNPATGEMSDGYLQYERVLGAFIKRYSRYDPSMVAFELFNEPPGPEHCTGDWANHIQPQLYRMARTLAPKHTIICTGAYWSSIPYLCALDPARYDENVLWTIHPLIPAPFSQQGYIYSQYKYVEGLHYPPSPTEKASAIASMQARVRADGTLSPSKKATTVGRLRADLEAYFDTPQNHSWIDRQFDQVTDWCAANRIAPASIYVGEYGATRSNAGFPDINVPGYQGCSRLDRALYLADLKTAILRHGFRCAPDHLDTQDYGLTQGQNAEIGPWDPLLLSAISPHLATLRY
jgi:endoglucanase